MTKVYILSTYQEEGAENVTATLDKTKLHVMLDGFKYGNGPKEHEKLAELIEADEIDVNGTNLDGGWGGTILNIVELVGSKP